MNEIQESFRQRLRKVMEARGLKPSDLSLIPVHKSAESGQWPPGAERQKGGRNDIERADRKSNQKCTQEQGSFPE